MLERVSAGSGQKSVCQLWVASSPQGTISVCSAMHGFSDLLGGHFTKYHLDYANFSTCWTRDTFHPCKG